MRLRRLMAVALFITSYCISNAQITADEAIVAMGRGINMGNTLDATNYEGGWGTEAREYYFDMYKEAGFKTIRIPITWSAGVSASNLTPRVASAAPYTINEDFFKRLDTIINWSLERDMYTIINVHHDGWVKVSSTFDENKARLFALWEQVADRYKDYSDKLMFEILNEPHSENSSGVATSVTTAQVDELNSKCLDIIRVDNPNRIVVYMGPNWSSSADLKAAAVPDPSDEYLIASYHSYDPWDFAGEGNGTWGNANDKKVMTDQMESVKEWSETNDIPVLIGELGAMDGCEYNSRMRYYAHYIQEAMRIGLAFTVWDDDGMFQVLQRKDTSWNDIKDVLIHTTEQSPTNVESTMQKGEDTTIVVSWTNRAIACDSIFLQKRLNKGDFETIAKFTGDTTSYTDTNFEEKNYYYYRVIARYNDSIDVYSYPTSIYVISGKRSPFHDEAFAIPGTIEAEDFDYGGQGISYNETTANNQGDALEYRPGEIVDVEVRTDGGYQVGYAEPGEWLEYTIDVVEAGSYEITAYLASSEGGGEIQFAFQNTASAKVAAPNTNDWQTTAPVSTIVDLEAGEQIMRVNILSTPNFNIDKIVIGEPSANNNTLTDNTRIYPNPASSMLYVEAPDAEMGSSIEIVSIAGKIVFQSDLEKAENGIPISELSDGYYFVRISSQNQTITKKFIKR